MVQVEKKIPWDVYPRKQFERASYQTLNGPWMYQISKDGKDALWKSIQVPFGLGCELSMALDTLHVNQTLWMKRTFTVEFESKHVIMNFEAVDQVVRVFINGEFVGEHFGGYAPFSLEITPYLKDENEVLLEIQDNCDEGLLAYGLQSHEVSEGCHSGISGVWGSCWLEGIEDGAITDVKITPDYDRGLVYLSLAGNFKQCVVTVVENERVVHRGITNQKSYTIPLKKFRSWTVDDPFLYRMYLQSEDDIVKTYFAMRKFSKEVVDGVPRFCMNNEPLFLSGVLDCGYSMRGGFTYESFDAMVEELKKVKELGFNMIRKFVKQENRLFYYVCDCLGILVMQDMMSGGFGEKRSGLLPRLGFLKVDDTNYEKLGRKNELSRDYYYQELDAMMDTLYNSPCVFAWCLFHEGWGQFDSLKVYEHVKAYDSTRLVDCASGFYDQGGGDFCSKHVLKGSLKLPKNEERILMVSCFGDYAYEEAGHTRAKRPYGAVLFDDKLSLNDRLFALYQKEIVSNIDKGLSIAIYSMLKDVEDHCSGLFTADGKILKVEGRRLRRLNEKMIRGK